MEISEKYPLKYPYPIIGTLDVNMDDDPLMVGSVDPRLLVDCRNIDIRPMTRKLRNRYRNTIDNNTIKFYSSGVFFPDGSKASFPLTVDDYWDSFYMASKNSSGQAENTLCFLVTLKLKCDAVVPYDRYIFRIKHPWSNAAGTNKSENYMALEIVPGAAREDAYIKFTMTYSVTEGSTDVEDLRTITIGGADVSGMEFPCDGKWHQIAIGRNFSLGPTESYIAYFLDGLESYEDATDLNAVFMPSHGQLLESSCTYEGATYETKENLSYNALWIGEGGNMSIAEFIMRDFPRSVSQGQISNSDYETWLTTYKNIQLTEDDYTASDAYIVCYIPFDEGGGKVFTDKITEATGYFSPQEPFVNDDGNLVFTGSNCVARPSKSSSHKLLMDQLDTMDGEEDSGPLFPVSPDQKFEDYKPVTGTLENIEKWYEGTVQIKIKLRGLKEGCIGGNLWIVRISDSSIDQGYALVLRSPSSFWVYSSAFTPDWYATNTAGQVDESWIGVEKTITYNIYLSVSGGTPTYKYNAEMWVDGDSVTLQTIDEITFFDLNAAASYQKVVPSYMGGDSSSGRDDYNFFTKPMLGGHEANENHCLPFELIFMRAWAGSKFTQDDVDNTYSIEDLPIEYLVRLKGFPGYIYDDDVGFSKELICILESELGPFSLGVSTKPMGIITTPHQFYTDVDDMDDKGFVYQTDYRGKEIMYAIQQRLAFRVNSVYKADITLFDNPYGNDYYMPSEARGQLRLLNGIDYGHCISYYNTTTFQNNLESRIEFDYEADDGRFETPEWGQLKGILSLHNVIVSDTKIQGRRKYGLTLEKTRFLRLGTQKAFANIKNVDQPSGDITSSLQIKWVTCGTGADTTEESPAFLTKPKAIRGIYQYISEDGKINKLIVVVHNTVYSYDPDTQNFAPEPNANMDNVDDEQINFTIANNKLILMDSNNAIKLNHKNNWSTLGIHRPNKIYAEAWPSIKNGSTYGAFDEDRDYHYAYTAQYYDEENNARSGTLPIFPTSGQGVKFQRDLSGTSLWADFIIVNCSTHLDGNVNRVKFYRTLDLNVNGAASDLFLTVETGVNKFKELEGYFNTVDPNAYGYHSDLDFTDTNGESHKLLRRHGNRILDIWEDSKLSEQPMLDTKFIGVDAVPPRSKAMGMVLGRFCVGNTPQYSNGFQWCELDVLGLPIPDEILETNLKIVTRGELNEITGIIQAADTGLLFQREAVHKIVEYTPNILDTKLVVSKIGCINQRCCTRVGESIYFLGHNGLYKYSGGLPTLVSKKIRKFFEQNINRNEIESSFIVYESNYHKIRCYVPSTNVEDGDKACDMCIVYDIEREQITFEEVPEIVCGYETYVNGEYVVYLGNKWGSFFRIVYDDNYIEGMDQVIVDTDVTITGKVISIDGPNTNWPEGRYGMYGLPVFLIKQNTGTPTSLSIWKGMVSEINYHSGTVYYAEVEKWIPLYNATSDPINGTYDSVIFGGMYYHFKTPVLNFPDLFFEKLITKIEFFTNKINLDEQSNFNINLGITITLNHGQRENKYLLSLQNDDDFSYISLQRERSRFIQVEVAGVSIIPLDIKAMVFHVTRTGSKLDTDH